MNLPPLQSFGFSNYPGTFTSRFCASKYFYLNLPLYLHILKFILFINKSLISHIHEKNHNSWFYGSHSAVLHIM